jgi:hypothetical protein
LLQNATHRQDATALNFSGNSLKLLRSMSSDRGFVYDCRAWSAPKLGTAFCDKRNLSPAPAVDFCSSAQPVPAPARLW